MEQDQIIYIKREIADKWERLREAIDILTKLHIVYSVHNNGLHIILYNDDEKIDYWATTGKWYIEETKHKSTHDEKFLKGLLNHMGYVVKEID